MVGCGAGGSQVVTVTEVKNPYNGLKEDEVTRIEELRKQIDNRSKDTRELNHVIRETPSFTVQEYLQRYPDAASRILSDYSVGGYDVIGITVYEEKDLTTDSIRVSADGFISFPFLGRVYVAGLTASEIEKLLTRKLAEGQYLFDAHVTVMVKQYESKKYAVLGAVKNPATYPLQARERLLDAISKAGGIEQEGGEAQEAMIIRTGNPGGKDNGKIVITVNLQGLLKGNDQISNVFIADQDVVYVPRANYFYIMGEVKNPGSFSFNKRNITIVEAISMAGGFTPIAARNRTRIIRIEGGSEKIYNVNVDAITQEGKMIQAVQIKANDLIVVPESFF